MYCNIMQIEDSDYYITDTGEVFKKITQTERSDGYMAVKINNNGDRKTKKVHRLVAEAFVANPEEAPQVNHKDGDKANNKSDNLEWVNNSKNIQHAYDNNLIDKHKKRLLSDETIAAIKEMYVPYDKEFGTRGLAKKFNVSPSCISYCIKKIQLEEVI